MRSMMPLALAAGLCISVAASASELRGSVVREDGQVGVYHFKDWTPMPVDTGRIAFKMAAGDASVALAAAGIKPTLVTQIGIPGWNVAEIDAKTPAEIRTLVLKLAGLDMVEFASPVMIGNEGLPVWVTPGVMAGTVDGAEAARDTLATLAGAQAGQNRWENFPSMDYFPVDAKDGYAVLDVANTMAAMPDFAFAEADLMITGRENAIPNDPQFGNLWGLHNTGQFQGGVVDFDMDGPEAWDVTIGTGNIIAVVLDIGMQTNHPDLNVAPFNADFTGNGTGGNPGNQCDNHGTAVASCIASIINNSRDVVGIAPGCRVASARIGVSNIPCNGTWNGNLSFSADALNWAQSNGARVTNNSNSYGGTSSAVETAYANTRNAGLVHFASAGNGAVGSIAYPSSIAGVNSVAALALNGTRAGFSQWGPGLDFSAPGEGILTSDRTGGDGYAGGDTAWVNGTSFASPYAAGVACLVLSKNSALSAGQVESIMASSARDMGAGGYDTDFGWGFVQARAALDATPGAAPGNNNCGSATDVSAGGVYTGTLVDATTDGSNTCGTSNSSPDVWYTFTAPSASVGGTLVVSTCGTHDANGPSTGIDTVLSVHSSCGGSVLACNDDNTGQCGGLDQGTLRDSYIALGLAPGQTVKIRVANFNNGARGPFRLNVAYNVANDACANATDVSAGGTFNGTLVAATSDGPGICGQSDGNPDVWYTYTHGGSCQNLVTFTTCGSNSAYGIDTVLSVFDGCGGANLGCNDDYAGCGLDSGVSVNLFPGQTVKVRVSKYLNRIINNFVLNVSAGNASNDSCGNAMTITDGSYTVCNTNATTDGPTEGNCSFGFGDLQVNGDVWFRYTAPVTGITTVSTCAGGNFDTKLAVYAGGCPAGPNTAIACNDDACGLLSQTQFNATAGQTYLVRFGGFNTARGTATLSIATESTGCPADFNGDGFLDFFDYDDFVTCFESSNCPPGRTADFNGDDFVDFFDYDDYVVAFEQGC